LCFDCVLAVLDEEILSQDEDFISKNTTVVENAEIETFMTS